MKRFGTIIAFLALTAANCFAERIDWTNKSANENLADLEVSTREVNINGTVDGLLYTGTSPDMEIRTTIGVLLGTLSTYSDVYPEINTMKIRTATGYLSMREWPGETELGIDPMETMSPYDPGSEWDLAGMTLSDFFVMEVGYIDYDMGDENDPSTWDSFHLVAYSDSLTLQDLYNANHVSPRSSLPPPPYVGPWIPTTLYGASAVPEPSTALLAVAGICLLLKRRNPAHA